MLDAAAIPRPLTRAEYDRMVARGLFEDERIELLRGELVPMSPQGPMHAQVVTRLVRMLVMVLHGRAMVRPQCPLAVSGDSEPEPDLAVVSESDYSIEHPTTAHLVIEVADSSLSKDRGIKVDLYAECSIPEYWIVNVMEQVIEVHTNPQKGTYRAVMTKRRGDFIELIDFPDVQIAVDSIF